MNTLLKVEISPKVTVEVEYNCYGRNELSIMFDDYYGEYPVHEKCLTTEQAKQLRDFLNQLPL